MLDWLKPSADVDQLIARGRLRQAIKELRRQVAAAPDRASLALRLADVLARDDQPDEAVGVLMPLVDRFAKEGFVAKAVAVLKKIERLDPERAESARRLIARFSSIEGRLQAASAPVIKPATVEPPPAKLPKVPPRTSEHRLAEDWLAAAKDRDGVSFSPLFEDLKPRQLESVIGALALVIKHPGAIIFSQGEPGASLFILASGAARVYVLEASGKNRQVGVIEEGAFFGAASLVHGLPRSATIVAAATCELLELDRKAFQAISREHATVRDRIARYVADLADRGKVIV